MFHVQTTDGIRGTKSVYMMVAEDEGLTKNTEHLQQAEL